MLKDTQEEILETNKKVARTQSSVLAYISQLQSHLPLLLPDGEDDHHEKARGRRGIIIVPRAAWDWQLKN